MTNGRRCVLLLAVVLPAAAVVARADEFGKRSRRTPVVEVFEHVQNSIVNISAKQIVEVRRSHTGFHSLFDEIFDFPTRRFARSGVGSGFVIHRDGFIVTNAHVVAKTAERTVTFTDGREFAAEIVALDTDSDLAVLSIESPEPLEPIRLGRSDDLLIGETVIAVGNPLGYQNTVTAGVVSALDRALHFSDRVAYHGLIQTDASINPGNSGGPLLNINGELIGVNTAIRGDAQNIGFAIPVDQLRKVLPDVLDLERLKRAWLGMRITGGNQALVTRLDADGPADRGGIRIGDRITAVDSVATPRDIDVYLELLAKEPGDTVHFAVLRDDRPRQAEVRIARIPTPDGAELAKNKLGLILTHLPPDLARRLGLKSGVVVVEVVVGGPGERVGIEPGDVVFYIGRHVVPNLDVAGRLLEGIERGDLIDVSVLRAVRGHLEQYVGRIRAR